MPVLDQLKATVDPDAFFAGYGIIKKVIAERQPEYVEWFDYVMAGKSMFPFQMFITRKEILDRYCEWLFSILIPAAEQINVDGFSAYSKRIIGFFAERLLTVWLVSQPLRIRKMPVWKTE